MPHKGGSNRVPPCATNLKVGYRGYDRTWEEDNYPKSLALDSDKGVEQHILPADLSVSFDHMKGALLTVGTDYQRVSYETGAK